MVAAASPSSTTTPDGADSTRRNVSSASDAVSPRTATAMVFVTSPGSKTSVPEAAS
jgi:hypothetical protein